MIGAPMEFHFVFDDEGRQLTTTLSGTPTVDDFRTLAQEVMADPRFRSNMLHLVDCTGLAVIENEDILLDEMGPLAERDWTYPPQAVAIVAPQPGMYERAVFARAHLGGSLVNREVFADRATAQLWLNQHAT